MLPGDRGCIYADQCHLVNRRSTCVYDEILNTTVCQCQPPFAFYQRQCGVLQIKVLYKIVDMIAVAQCPSDLIKIDHVCASRPISSPTTTTTTTTYRTLASISNINDNRETFYQPTTITTTPHATTLSSIRRSHHHISPEYDVDRMDTSSSDDDETLPSIDNNRKSTTTISSASTNNDESATTTNDNSKPDLKSMF